MSTIQLSEQNQVIRQGDTVLRPIQPWTPSIHDLISHFHRSGLPVPKVYSSDENGNEVLEYLEGSQVHPQRWSDEGLYGVGMLVRLLHDAGRRYTPPEGAQWKPWCLRELGNPSVYSHGDIAPWNIITKNGHPSGLIDWEYAGPIDPLTELARVCWLFPQLHDDDIAEKYGLPDAKGRAKQVSILLDAYKMPRQARKKFIDRILEVVICETAHEAIDIGVTEESEGKLWGISWRARSAYWIQRNRTLLRTEV